jgi:hypothetical protein
VPVLGLTPIVLAAPQKYAIIMIMIMTLILELPDSIIIISSSSSSNSSVKKTKENLAHEAHLS